MRFNKNSVLLGKALMILVVSLHGTGHAQVPASDKNCPPPLMPLEQQMAYVTNSVAKNAGYLWRAEKDGRTSWLYGTMHLNHIDYAKPGSQVMMGMRNSDLLALEINPYEQQNLPASFKQAQWQLSDQQLKRLTLAYEKDCLNVGSHPISPTAGTQPLQNTQAQRQSLHWAFSPDTRLAQIAKRTGKTIVQLETLEQHIMALAPTSQAEFDQFMDAALVEVESGKMQSDLTALNLAWQKNDWTAIVKLEQDLSGNQPAFASRLLDQRNVLMAEKIDALHQSGKRAFVAVGAMHMAGKTALPKLMQDKGYVVTFVPLRN